jgi:hypothetical protein
LATALEQLRRDIYSLIQLEYGQNGGAPRNDEGFFFGPLHQAFKTVAGRGASKLRLGGAEIKEFMEKNGETAPILEGALESIISRLDRDKDGRLSFEEFMEGLLPDGLIERRK